MIAPATAVLLVAYLLAVGFYFWLFRWAEDSLATARRAAAQLDEATEIRRQAEDALASARAREAVEMRVSKAVNVVYHKLADEQVRLQAIEQRQRNGSSDGDAKVTKHRAEGITAAIRILTSEAGRAGHVFR